MEILPTVIAGLVVVLIVILAVRNLVKNHKNGNCGCGCGCENCPAHCGSSAEQSQKKENV